MENMLAGRGKSTVDNSLCNEVCGLYKALDVATHIQHKRGMSWIHLQDGQIKNTKEMLEGKKYMVVDQQGSQTTGGEIL
jgi:hypothetical protein